MFGISLTKIIFTVVIVAVVWTAFKRLGGIKDQSEKPDRVRKAEEAARAATEAKVKDAEDLVPCPSCGAYIPVGSTCESCSKS